MKQKATRWLAPLLLGNGPKGARGKTREWWVYCASWIVIRFGVFDPEHYVMHNPDVEGEGIDPLRHYLLYGDREGRRPMPWFDPEHYRRSLPFPIPRGYNTLLHYLLVGRSLYPEVSASFDTKHFYEQNREVRLNLVEALSAFRSRRHETADHYSPYAVRTPAPIAREPAQEDWMDLPRQSLSDPAVDIVVPVFLGRAETLCCIHSVLRAGQNTSFRLVVVNDGSPDKELAADLRRLAARGLFDLVENEKNTGFVCSVNRAMSLHPGRDIVLLNADTEPHNDWLDRLRSAAYSQPRIATVTPLSNNATIASYPRPDCDNPGPLELTSRELDRLAATVNRGNSINAPTGVGFCLYIRRRALEDVGPFDEAAFGKGYGEENDFCRRAAEAGWENRIAADVYVWHWGSRSFLGEKTKRISRAVHILERRYPGYRRLVEEFASADVLAPYRRELDRARLLRRRLTGGNVLVLLHNRGGGAAKQAETELQRLASNGTGGFLLQPENGNRGRLTAPGMPRLPNLPPVDFGCAEQLGQWLDALGITEVHIHQLVDFPRSFTGDGHGAARGIATAARQRGIPLDFYIHDYQYICPRINLVGPDLVYCREPDEAACRRCLSKRIPGLENPRGADIRAWRIRHEALFASARRIVVPDRDVLDRLSAYYPNANYLVRPHENPDTFPPTGAARSGRSGPLRILVPGAISVIKGFDVFLAAAKAAKRWGLPLEFVVLGYTRRDRDLLKVGVRITGRYRDEEADDALREIDADVAWIPSVWPETYCYAMSVPLRAGLPVAAFDLGAQAARLRRHAGPHLLLPLALARQPRKLAAALETFAAAQRKAA